MILRRFDKLRQDSRIYRSRNGMIFGVCKGVAEYFDFSVFWVRTITLLLFLFTGFWPIGVLYILAVFIMKPEPVVPIGSIYEQEFYDAYLHSRPQAINRLKRRYDSLKRRIERMEDRVTSSEFNWDSRFKR